MKWIKKTDEFVLTREELSNLTDQLPWIKKKDVCKNYERTALNANKCLYKYFTKEYIAKIQKKL